MVDRNRPTEVTERPAARTKGERLVVTALFADVVNSTGVAEKLDPGDWTDIMNGHRS
jgi:class 3 adenylate cyclase